MDVISGARVLVVRAALVLLVAVAGVTPAAAQGALFGQQSVPEDVKPLMQKPFGILVLVDERG